MLKLIAVTLLGILYLALWKPELNWLVLPIEIVVTLIVIRFVWKEEKDNTTPWADVINACQKKNGKFDNDIKRVEQITLSPFTIFFFSILFILVGGLFWIQLI